MKLSQVIIILLFYTLYSCGTSKEFTQKEEANYEIKRLNIIENALSGNIVIEVFDTEMNPITDYQSIIISDGEEIFNVHQKSSQSTFFVDKKEVVIKIKKDGYKTVKTNSLSTDTELEFANYIKVKMEKE